MGRLSWKVSVLAAGVRRHLSLGCPFRSCQRQRCDPPDRRLTDHVRSLGYGHFSLSDDAGIPTVGIPASSNAGGIDVKSRGISATCWPPSKRYARRVDERGGSTGASEGLGQSVPAALLAGPPEPEERERLFRESFGTESELNEALRESSHGATFELDTGVGDYSTHYRRRPGKEDVSIDAESLALPLFDEVFETRQRFKDRTKDDTFDSVFLFQERRPVMVWIPVPVSTIKRLKGMSGSGRLVNRIGGPDEVIDSPESGQKSKELFGADNNSDKIDGISISRVSELLAEYEAEDRSDSLSLERTLGALAVRRELIDALRTEIDSLVDAAREQGGSWAKIGKAMNMGHQSAYEHWSERGREKNRERQRRRRQPKAAD